MHDHRNDAVVRLGGVPGRMELTFGNNSHGVKVWDGDGNMTAYYGGLGDAVYAYDQGSLDYVAEAFGQGSTHYSYAAGIQAGPVDAAILKPHTSWSGSRGVRMNFGGDPELDEFGRLYRSPPFHVLEQASPGDLGALQGRSGWSGYRGGRPTFGDDPTVYGGDARIDIGPIRYQGSPWGAAALGIAGLILLFQGPMRS